MAGGWRRAAASSCALPVHVEEPAGHAGQRGAAGRLIRARAGQPGPRPLARAGVQRLRRGEGSGRAVHRHLSRPLLVRVTPLKRWYNSVMTRGTGDHRQFRLHPRPRPRRARPRTRPRSSPSRAASTWRASTPPAVAPERVAALASAWGLAAGDRRTRFLLAGRLTRWKGQTLAIEAAARLKARGPRTTSLIVFAGDDQGRTGYRDELRGAIADGRPGRPRPPRRPLRRHAGRLSRRRRRARARRWSRKPSAAPPSSRRPWAAR